MIAEIIAVGTEILLGDIVNTNAQFLSEELAMLGITVHYQTVVGDNPGRLEQVIQQARGRSDLLIFSGGLGPTEDDLTKQTVAKIYGDTLQFDEEELKKIETFFANWGRTMPENNKRQAYVPQKGFKIPNENGTAPGMVFEDSAQQGKYAVLLPGPPREQKPMFLQTVKPWLAAMSEQVLYSLTLRVMGVGESHLQEQLGPLLENENPTAALYAKTSEVAIRITAREKTTKQAQVLCEEYAKQFYEILGDCIYTQTENSLQEVVVHTLAKTGTSVATAESCTGGMLSAHLTQVAGASEVFSYGVCTYANQAKETLLQVKQETLEQYGAVSSETAAEMALGIRNLAKSSFGISITGIAGPDGGTKEKPVGLVYLAITDGAKTYVQRLVITGRPRTTVRAGAVQNALELIRRMTLGLPQPMCEEFTAGQPAHLSKTMVTKDV